MGQHQARCSRTRGCAYFTAFPIQPNLFWCHLQDCERSNGMLRMLTKCPGFVVEPNDLRQDDQQPGLVRINHWCYILFFSFPVSNLHHQTLILDWFKSKFSRFFPKLVRKDHSLLFTNRFQKTMTLPASSGHKDTYMASIRLEKAHLIARSMVQVG